MLPTRRTGRRSAAAEDLRRRPHAWVKLWKHHAAQPEADRVNAVATEPRRALAVTVRRQDLVRVVLPEGAADPREDPEVYARAGRLIEAADWIVWQLTGVETRNTTTAGYKAIWSKADGFPSRDYFAALDPRFENVVDEKMSRHIDASAGAQAGSASARQAWTDSARHAGGGRERRRARVRSRRRLHRPGRARRDHGHEQLPYSPRRPSRRRSRGCAASSRTASCRASSATRRASRPSATSSPGSSRTPCRPSTTSSPRRAARTCITFSKSRRRRSRPGESGLLALDWWNGNRSVLVDADLARARRRACRLSTRPHEIYRALIEATAFGTRVIVEAFEQRGRARRPDRRLRGLPDRNRLLMQIYADVLGRPIGVAASQKAPALGAAMFGAVAPAAGRIRSIAEASRADGGACAGHVPPGRPEPARV